jgi:DNA polymerase III delta subunit
MEAHATYDDVNLILRLYELRREQKMRTARDWFARNFKAATLEESNTICPQGSEENAYLRMVLSYWEMVASFITSGVLNQELFFQSGGELLFVWERFRTLLPQAREQYKSPGVYKNLEAVAQAFIQWMNKNSPGAYEAFSARVKGS